MSGLPSIADIVRASANEAHLDRKSRQPATRPRIVFNIQTVLCLTTFSASLRSLFEKPDDEQENYGSDDGVDYRCDDATDENKTDQRQQPAGNECANNADDDITNEPETVALDDQTRESTGNSADD